MLSIRTARASYSFCSASVAVKSATTTASLLQAHHAIPLNRGYADAPLPSTASSAAPKRHPEMVKNSLRQWDEYMVKTYVRPEIVFVKGQGAFMWDSTGKRYLDFYSGIAVNALGHGDIGMNQTLMEQAGKLAHVSNLFHSQPALDLAELLVKSSFADKVFFSNSGTEANEGAIKFARKWGRLQDSSGKKIKVVAFAGGFHGRTMGSLSATHNPAYQEVFAPLIPGNVVGKFNSIESINGLIDKDTCAVIVEPIQGEGGIYPATREFLAQVRHLCDQHNVLLIFDEVQCGFGRTGHLWAHEHPMFAGILPDIMTVAKPLAGGLPIGAILVKDKVSDIIKPGDHGSTFSGGPLICATAQTVFKRVNDPLFLANIRNSGRHFVKLLKETQARHPNLINDVRGHGLMIGVDVSAPLVPKQITELALEKGLIVISAGKSVIRIVPPLIVTNSEIELAAGILGECFDELSCKLAAKKA